MTPAQRTRNYNHRHNALIGSASCFRCHLQAIISAPSTSPEAKLLAVEMQQLQQRLVWAVRSARINADGTRTDFPLTRKGPSK